MRVPFVDFGAQYLAHKDEYDENYSKLMSSGKLILQEEGEKFEENLANFLGMKYAVAVANGTDALEIALRIKKKQENRNVLRASDYTFKATHEAIYHAGYIPERVDINSVTRMPDSNVDVPVHIEGMVHYSPTALIEDACQAFGAKGVGYSGTACYSFYPAKIMGCQGDGGAIVTNDRDMYDLAKLYRHHYQTGVDEDYGFNSRLDNIKAGFLNIRLKYIPAALKRREEIAKKYLMELDGYLGLPFDQEGRVWQDFVVTHPKSKELVKFLKENEIGILGNDMVPNFEAMNCTSELTNVKNLYETMFRLPCNETLTDEQTDFVVSKVKEYVSTM